MLEGLQVAMRKVQGNIACLLRLVLCGVLLVTPVVTWAIAPLKAYTQAVDLYRSGQYAQAFQQFSALMQANPEDVRLPYYLALTSVRLGKLEQAQRFYEVVLSIAPKSLVAPYAKQGLALLQQAQLQPPSLDAPPSVGGGAITLVDAGRINTTTTVQPNRVGGSGSGTAVTTGRNTLVAEWQKRHPTVGISPIATTRMSNNPVSAVVGGVSTTVPALPQANTPAVAMPALSLPATATVPSVQSLPSTTSTEVSITPAMVTAAKMGQAPLVSSVGLGNTVPTATTTPEQQSAAAQQQQQLMQTMMMMQLMNGANTGNTTTGGGNNPMAMMLPLMMMQQNNTAVGGGNNTPLNPFGGIDSKTMSDLMTQGMMNNLDLFSDNKRNNDN